jgi:hypothetical protein
VPGLARSIKRLGWRFYIVGGFTSGIDGVAGGRWRPGRGVLAGGELLDVNVMTGIALRLHTR